jgi:hypothetical protein
MFGQWLAEFRFQGVKRMAGIGRGAVVAAGGGGETLGVRHAAEEPQRIQLHGDKSLIKKWKVHQTDGLTAGSLRCDDRTTQRNVSATGPFSLPPPLRQGKFLKNVNWLLDTNGGRFASWMKADTLIQS